MYPRGHDGAHECECAFDEGGNRYPRIEADGVLNIGAPPYYGPDTEFYGEDAEVYDSGGV
jgi:hypothetical protein